MPSDPRAHDSEAYLKLDSDDAGELGDKVQQVRAELESLRQKQEEIEREKTRLEELKRRQETLEEGRSDMLDKLTRALVVVQRETEESQQRVEQMHAIYNSFTQHLRQMEAINARGWAPQDLPRELSKALSAVEDARSEYIKAQAKLSVDTSGDIPPASSQDYDYSMDEDRGFTYWLRTGFAFTLPLQAIALVALLVYIWSVTASK
jgi:DNA repair exonuclease SbcCD ATPase subunit